MKSMFLAMMMAVVQQHGGQHHDPRHSFEETERWVEEFESEERDAQQMPDDVVKALRLSVGDVVADVDLVFICNTIHHIGGRDQYYKILERDLRDGGRLAIVDFRKDADIEQRPDKAMRIARQALLDEVTAAGFKLVEEHDFLPVQYFLVFEAP